MAFFPCGVPFLLSSLPSWVLVFLVSCPRQRISFWWLSSLVGFRSSSPFFRCGFWVFLSSGFRSSPLLSSPVFRRGFLVLLVSGFAFSVFVVFESLFRFLGVVFLSFLSAFWIPIVVFWFSPLVCGDWGSVGWSGGSCCWLTGIVCVVVSFHVVSPHVVSPQRVCFFWLVVFFIWLGHAGLVPIQFTFTFSAFSVSSPNIVESTSYEEMEGAVYPDCRDFSLSNPYYAL